MYKIIGCSAKYLEKLDKQIVTYAYYHFHFHFYCSVVYTYKGHLQLQNKLHDAALICYDKAIFQDHKNGYAFLGKAIIAKMQKQNSEATESYNKGKELLALNGIDATYSVNSLFRETLQYLTKIVSQFDYQNISVHNYSNEPAKANHNPELIKQINEAKRSYATNNFPYAQTLFLQIVKQHPQLTYLYYPIANTYLHHNKLHQAIKYFSKYLKAYPHDKSAIFDLAYSKLRVKKPKIALEYFGQCVEPNIQQGRIFLGLGLSHFYLKKYAECAQTLEYAVEYALDEHDHYHKNFSKHYFCRAYYYVMIKNYDLATADLTKAIDLDSNNIDALLLRVEIYTKRKNYLGAVEDCNKILTSHPHNQTVKINLQKIQAHLGIVTKN